MSDPALERSGLASRILKGPTIKVVRADVTSCPLPGCGLSSSVIKKTLLVAVLGALVNVITYWDLASYRCADIPVSQNPIAAGEDITHRHTLLSWGKLRLQFAWVFPGVYMDMREWRAFAGRHIYLPKGE